MSQTNRNSWIGFIEAQKAINALKEEVEIAEKKLSFAKKSLKSQNNNKFGVSLLSKNTEQQKNFRPFIKEPVLKQFSYTKSKTLSDIVTVMPPRDTSPNSEEQPFLEPPKVSSSQFRRNGQTLVKSLVDDSILRVSEESSCFSSSQKPLSSEKTSSLIGDIYKYSETELSNIIYRSQSSEDASKITFTSWEQQFLRNEIDSDIRTNSSPCSDFHLVAGMEWTPVINDTKVPKRKPKRATSGDLQSLKEIIKRQKKLHESLLKSESEINNTYHTGSLGQECNKEDERNLNAILQIESEAGDIKSPPLRKRCLVTSVPQYRGFNIPGDLSRKRPLKAARISTVSVNRTVVSKRIKRNITHKSKILPLNHSKKQVIIPNKSCERPEEKSLPGKVEDPPSCAEDRLVSPKIDNSDKTLSSSTSKSQKEVDIHSNEKKTNDTERIDSSPLKDEATDNEYSTLNDYIADVNHEQLSRTPAMREGVKRKTAISIAEKLSPSPKIRHYDTQKVREFIKKKKAERRRRHLEEDKKKVLETVRKQEGLQKLYEYQKQCLKSLLNAKNQSPTKIAKKENKTVNEMTKFPSNNSNEKGVTAIPINGSSNSQTAMPQKVLQSPSKGISSAASSLSSLTDSDPHRNEIPEKLNSSTSKVVRSQDLEKETNRISNLRSSISLENTDTSKTKKVLHSKVGSSSRADTSVPNGVPLFEENEANFNNPVSDANIHSTLVPSEENDVLFTERLQLEKITFQSAHTEKAAYLKNLVKTISEMTAPYDHFIRTKQWLEESPPPPGCKLKTKSASAENAHSKKHAERSKNLSSDFVFDIAKSLHTDEVNSFREQVSDIGDTSQLFEKLLSKLPNTEIVKFDSKEQSLQEIQFEEGLIEGSLESDDDDEVPSHTQPSSMAENGLIEGSLVSEEGTEDNSKMDLSQDTPLLFPRHEGSMIAFESNEPDPFNFINTWNRKPLNFPTMLESKAKSFKSSVSLSLEEENHVRQHKSEDSTTDLTLDGNETQIDESSAFNTAVNSSAIHSSHISSFSESSVRDGLTSTQTEAPSGTGTSSRSASIKSSYSFESTPSVSSDKTKSSIQKQSISEVESVKKKMASPPESSLSEVISVIQNSKNGIEQQNVFSEKSSPPLIDNTLDTNGIVSSGKDMSVGSQISDKNRSILHHSLSGTIPKQRSFDRNSSSESSIPESIHDVLPVSENDHFQEMSERSDKSRDSSSQSNSSKRSLNEKSEVLHEENISSRKVVLPASGAEISKSIKEKDSVRRRILWSPVKEVSSARSGSPVSQKVSSNNSAMVESSHSRSSSENTVIEEENNMQSPIETPEEARIEEVHMELDFLPGVSSVSSKVSPIESVPEELPMYENEKKLEDIQKKIRYRKVSGNLSSPSPASLSDTKSLSEATLVSQHSIVSSSALSESVLSDDSFAQLTLDVVRKMTHEEELRASHQLAFLKFQEKTLVENARSEMAWLEALKKKLKEKGATKKASLIKRRQKDIILRLRQERAQLRCMQEAYRNICEKSHSFLADKKKLLGDVEFPSHQTAKKKERSSSSKTSSEHIASFSKQKSNSSSTSAILTEEELKTPEEKITPETIQDKSSPDIISSQGSVVETAASEQAQSSISSIKSHRVSPVSSTPLQQEHSQSSLSVHSNNSVESAVCGLKKLEASKRHLTKREQRILQRRKHVEKLLQWQMKLDSEEMAVRELEQKAVALVDISKQKTKHYVSSSTSLTQEENEKLSAFTSEAPAEMTDNVVVATSDTLSPQKVPSIISESVQNESVSEEKTILAPLETSIEEEENVSVKSSNNHDTNSSIPEMDTNKSSDSFVKTAESSPAGEITEENEQSSHIKSPLIKKLSSSDTYSESFESPISQRNITSVPVTPVLGHSTPVDKKEHAFSIKSPLTPRNMRRHDSSGSDDSYTISHSETASDQSDIEVRIHALTEVLKQRKYEAEKLIREQKRKNRERLKGKELSLQKQVEAYDKIIQKVKSDLELTEAMSHHDVSSVKPQIKWPRPEQVLDSSRRMRKQPVIASDPITPEKKIPSNESSTLDSFESKREKSLISKLFSDPKEAIKSDSTEVKTASDKSCTEAVSTWPPLHENTVETVSGTSDGSQKSLENSKDETEIEEESCESSVSSIVTVDSVSEKNKTTSNEEKITHQSEYITTISSVTGTTSEKDLKAADKSTFSVVQQPAFDEVDQKNKDSLGDIEHLTDSDKTPSNGHGNSHESLPPSETEYSYQSSSHSNSSIKEILESGSFESDDSSSPSLGKALDKTFIVKEDVSDLSSPNEKGELLEVKKSLKFAELDQKSLKECLKSENLVLNVVNFVYTSALDDAIRNVLSLSLKPSKHKPCDIDESSSVSQHFNAPKLEAISSDILSSFLNDAISCIMGIANNGKPKDSLSSTPFENHELNTKQKNCPATHPAAIQDGRITNVAQSLVTVHPDKSDTTIFKKQTDWLEEGFVAAQWTNQQLEQQLLLQQYPYYYRKIPNKPPPPYTPPATSVSSPQLFTHVPLPIKKEKATDKDDSIQLITNNISGIIDDIAEALLDGKKSGLDIREIACPDFTSVTEKLNLKLPCQIIYLDLIFDLAKEVAMDVYNETEPVPTPWLRPRRLTPKPRFPSDKGQLSSVLLKEVEKALKLTPPPSEVKRRRPPWSSMKLGRKKRDFVDTILIGEIREEEPDWVDYDQDEVTVKLQIADSIFDALVSDTVGLLKDIDHRLGT